MDDESRKGRCCQRGRRLAGPADHDIRREGRDTAKRDDSLPGADGRHAVEVGLAAAEWYRAGVPRKVMKVPMQRSDQPAIRDTILLYTLMITFCGLGVALWPSWWSAPVWLAYGVLYGFANDSRWHECSHGTAFRTPWLNNAVYEIASRMIMRNSATWRWSHARHHTNTYIAGRDLEFAVMRRSGPRRLITAVQILPGGSGRAGSPPGFGADRGADGGGARPGRRLFGRPQHPGRACRQGADGVKQARHQRGQHPRRHDP
jgi:hypothetical protein